VSCGKEAENRQVLNLVLNVRRHCGYATSDGRQFARWQCPLCTEPVMVYKTSLQHTSTLICQAYFPLINKHQLVTNNAG